MTLNNAELLARRQVAIPRGVTTASGAIAARALNAEVWDIEGRRFIDFVGGIAVVNTGHCHPKVMAAARAQMDAFTHTSFQVMAYEPYIRLAEKLNDLAPVEGPAKTIFVTTGAEAVENAIKIARAATGRPGVIAFHGGFHGRTLFTSALTGKVAPYKIGFGPFPSEIYHAPFPADSLGVSTEDALHALEMIFKTEIESSRTAAIIIEPVQGEGGYHPAPPDFLRSLRAICDAHGILLIADEIQSGFARTGKWFAIEHAGVKPDLITVAKALAGGFPLAGVIGRAAVMDAPQPGGLGGTYGGNPIACAAALAVLEVIEEEKLLERSLMMGDHFARRLRAMAARNDVAPIAHVRHLGGMIGFDVVKDKVGYEPDADKTRALMKAAEAHGLLILAAGLYGNTIRIMVPVTASDAIIDEGLDKLEAALKDTA